MMKDLVRTEAASESAQENIIEKLKQRKKILLQVSERKLHLSSQQELLEHTTDTDLLSPFKSLFRRLTLTHF